MIYTKFYWGDYLRDTNFLSPAQHGYYMLMLADFYSKEKPIPADRKRLYKRLRAITEEERAELDEVIMEFWEETPEGLVNARAQKEIEEWQEYTEEQSERGRKGGRPAKKPSLSHGKASAKPVLSHGKANVKPSTSTSTSTNHNPEPEPKPSKKEDPRPQSAQDVEDWMLIKGAGPALAQRESEAFWNFYESKGWKVGKNPMRKWKAAATNWLNRKEDMDQNGNNTLTKREIMQRQGQEVAERWTARGDA